MTRFERTLAILCGIAAVLAILLPLGLRGEAVVQSWTEMPALIFPLLVLIILALFVLKLPPWASGTVRVS